MRSFALIEYEDANQKELKVLTHKSALQSCLAARIIIINGNVRKVQSNVTSFLAYNRL